MKTLFRLLVVQIFLLFFCGLQVQAQQENYNPQNPGISTVTELTSSYSEYFKLKRESVYLHLNKTAVVPGEGLWFSAYVYLPSSLVPSAGTANLRIGIYNSNGHLMEAKTVFIENGKGSGFFKMDSLYPPGKYFIRTSTKYMNNFREDHFFSQSFKILGKNNAPVKKRKYDLQLLPEGGHLVAHVKNTVGVKLIDNLGKGIYFTNGKVLDSENTQVTTFQSNGFGLSKFTFTPKQDEEYRVILTTEQGTEIKKSIPKPELEGIALTTITTMPNYIAFSIGTNQKTIDQLVGQDLFFTIHKNGKMRIIDFKITAEKMGVILNVPKKDLFPGTNIVTIFNQDLEPLVERLIFNREGIKRKELKASYRRRQQDSLVIGLHTSDSLSPHSLSISVLPGGTAAYNPNNGIFSRFYIEPYINGNLEDGGYYFSKSIKKRRRNYDLDLLLLTQGWSKYSWHNIFNNPPKEYFKPETGYIIAGKVNNRNERKENKLFIKSVENNLFATVELNEDGSFKLKNLFIQDSTELSFGLINKRNNKTTEPSIYVRILPSEQNEDLQNINLQDLNIEREGAINGEQSKIPEGFLKNTVNLESVVLETKIKKEEENKPLYVGIGARETKITEEMANSFFYITGLIRFKGFEVHRTTTGVTIYSRRNIVFSGKLSPAVYLNGVRMQNNSFIKNLKTSDVEYLYVNKSGMGAGIGGAGGVIHIQTKKDYSTGNKQNPTTSTIITKTGFAKLKEFYTPKYASYSSKAFENYGAIGWFPDVALNKNGKASLKIFNTLQPSLKLFISGMTADGALISEEILIRPD